MDLTFQRIKWTYYVPDMYIVAVENRYINKKCVSISCLPIPINYHTATGTKNADKNAEIQTGMGTTLIFSVAKMFANLQ